MKKSWRDQWYDLHPYERTTLAIVLAAGEDGYSPPEEAPKTGGACDRLAELGYLKNAAGVFTLVSARTRGFMTNLSPLAEQWKQRRPLRKPLLTGHMGVN